MSELSLAGAWLGLVRIPGLAIDVACPLASILGAFDIICRT